MKAHFSRRIFLAGGILIVMLASSPVIASPSLYGMQNYASVIPFPKTLYRINSSDGSYGIISENSVENIGGLAYNSSDGYLYGIQNYTSVVPFPQTLYRIDPSDGSYEIISENSVENIGGLTYNSSDGYLYGMQNYASVVPFPKILYRIDPSDGTYEIISENSVENIGGLAYNSSDGYLYGIDDYASLVPFPQTLYRIDPSDGSYEIISENSIENIGGLAYNSSDGYLYGMQNYGLTVPFPQTLYRIDPSDGSYTIVSNNCVENIGGLVYVPELQPTLPDFSISDVKPVQVVWNSDIDGDDVNDLVAGKSTAVLVYVGMKDYQGLDKQEIINIQLSFDGRNYTISRTIKELEEDGRIEINPGAPFITGDQEIIVQVETDNQEIGDANEINNEKTKDITVKETNSLHLVYFPVDGIDPDGPTGSSPGVPGFGYGPIDLTEYSDTVTNSGMFIQAVYPIAESKFTNEKRYDKYYGTPIPNIGVIHDLTAMWLWAELLTGTSADLSVGIVPSNYFDYHQLKSTHGAAFPGVPAALAEVDYWTPSAHEIGHTYGLWLKPPFGKGEEYDQPDVNIAKYASGYWVTKSREISDEGYCMMGSGHKEKSFFYAGDPVWICEEDYAYLFQKLRVDKTDPPAVLLLNGIISKDGTVQLGNLYMVENGIIDDIMPGDYSIKILDADGQTLTNIPFFTAFYAHLDFVGIVETDFAGFAFVIPYPENTAEIKILHNGQTLIEINPNSRLLHDAVDSIPDYGFIRNADQLRKALHNKIDEIEAKIENNEIQDATNKLEFDVKDKLEKWLADSYQPQNPLQLSKNEIIELVDNIVERLDIIQPRSSKDSEITGQEPEITDSDIEDADLDSEILAFLESPESDDHLDPDSPSTDAGEDSAIPEDGEEDIEEKPPTTDNGETDTGDDEQIAAEETVVFMLFEAADRIYELSPENFNNEDSIFVLTSEIDIVLAMIDVGLHTEARTKLKNDILERTNGCANVGKPDDNDWIRTYEGQGLVYPLIVEALELLEILI